MLTTTGAMSGFSADDTETARAFYRDTLGLDVRDGGMAGIIELFVTGGTPVLVYPKSNHEPASYTVLNLFVDDIDVAADELAASGVELLRYDGSGQDERGIMRSGGPEDGPSIAWFTDPAGNIFSIMQE
ncbi:MAG: VOC family protein [Microbacteriaceae bacterium]